MKYTRTLEIECEGCGATEVVRDGDPIEKHWRGEMLRDDAVAGENGQAIPLTSGVLFVLRRGWVAMTPRDAEGRHETFRAGARLESVPRGLIVVCPECAGKVIPPLSRAAQKAIEESEGELRSLLERLVRLEGQVSALTDMTAIPS